MTDEGNGAAQKTGEAIAPKTFTGNTPKNKNTTLLPERRLRRVKGKTGKFKKCVATT